MIATAVLVASASFSSQRCPTTLKAITQEANGIYYSRPAIKRLECRDSIASILKRAATANLRIRVPAFDFVDSDVKQLAAHCNSKLSEATKVQASQTYSDGFAILDYRRYIPVINTFIRGDDLFSKGDYAKGFSYFAAGLYSFANTESSEGMAAEKRGLLAASQGRFSAAIRDFRTAHRFATANLPFNDSLYFMGVAQLAIHQRPQALENFCTALPLTFSMPAEPAPLLLWNLLSANRIAHWSAQ